MVEAIFKLLRRETSGLHQAAFLLGIFAFLSQILALARDKLLAYHFGAGLELDLYYAAFRVPDFLFVTIGSLVSLSILIPFLIEQRVKGVENEKKFIDSIFSAFLYLIVGISIIVFFLTPLLVKNIFPGFSVESQKIVVVLTQILLLSPIFLGISNLFGSIVQSHNRFLVYAISPLVYNIGIIVGIVFLYKPFGLIGLVYGVIIGAIFHLAIQVPAVSHLSLLPSLILKLDFSVIKQVFIQSVPRTIALSVSHISILFLLSLASFMPEGSISIFNLAWNLQSVPLSVFGVSYSLAAFPALSRLYLAGEREQFLTQFTTTVRHIIFWLVPCTALFVVLRAHIVRVILGSGEFDWADTRLTAAVLAIFVFSVVFQAIVLLCIRALYATGSTGKPLSITLFSGIAIVVFAHGFSYFFETIPVFRFFFETLFKIPDVPGSQVIMLPLGFAMGTFLETILIWFYFTREWAGASRMVARSFFQIISSAVFLGFATYIMLQIINPWFSLSTFFGVVMQAFIAAIVGIIVWIFTLIILKNDELPVIVKTLHQKFWKQKPTSPDQSLA